MKYLLSLMALLLSLVPASAQSTIIYVNQTNANPNADGDSWATAYHELRDALGDPRIETATSESPIEVWVASGTYKPTPGTDRTKSFRLTSHLRLRGGFVGNETSFADRSFAGTVSLTPTILSGDIGLLQTNGVTTNTPLYLYPQLTFDSGDPGFQDNSENVLLGVGVTDVTLDGLTVTGGYASVDTNTMSSVQIGAMTIPDTSSESGDTLAALDNRIAGGGLAFINAPGWYENNNPDLTNIDLTVLSCIFIDNGARGYGGGVAVREAHVEMDYVTFLQNICDLEGGAFWGQNQLGYFQECYFQGNWSYRSGGAVHLESVPSLRTFNPGIDDAEFYSFYGHTKAEVLTNCWSYQGNVNAAIETTIGAIYGGTNPVVPAGGNADRTKRIEKDVKGLGEVLGKQLKAKLAARFGNQAANQAATQASEVGLGDVYGVIGDLVLATDLSIELTSLIPGSANWPGFETVLNGWNDFYTDFNTYATPTGLATLVYDLFEESLQTPADEQENDERGNDISYYNTMPNTLFLFCKFETNQTFGDGGALMDVYDNVQAEACVFQGNLANLGGAGTVSMGGTSPVLVSDYFNNNYSQFGHSAIMNAFRVQPRIFNCTIVNNGSGSTNGSAIDSELGADTLIGNSILWGNTNSSASTSAGGADLYVPTPSTLGNDTNYTEAGTSGFIWIGLCDVHFSCIQSMTTTPLGVSDIFIPHGMTAQEITQYNAEEATADSLGLLDYTGLFNLGNGTRPTILNPLYGNMNRNPGFTADGVTPSPGSPVLGAGFASLVDNDTFQWSITSQDIFGNYRFIGSLDMGAVQWTGNYFSVPLYGPFAFVPPPVNPNAPDPFQLAEIAYENFTNTNVVAMPLTNIYVNSAVAGGNHSGSNWANAMTTVPIAPAMATNGTLWIAAGNYELSGEIQLTTGMSIYGGFQGNETNVTQANPSSYPTILNGGGTLPQWLEISEGFTNVSVIHGLEFVNKAAGDQEGILADGNVVLSACVFSNNPGLSLLGAGANITVSNCAFASNAANAGAMIVLLTPGNLMTGCTFSNNAGTAVLDEYGVVLTNCVFTANSGADTQGILALQGGEALSCVFSNNTSLAVGMDAGTLSGSTFIGNVRGASANSSALDIFDGNVINCVFTSNFGLVVNAAYGNPVAFQNCDFFGNTGVCGMFIGSLLESCEFAGNVNPGAGAIAQFELANVNFTTFSNNNGLAAAGTSGTTFEGCQFVGNRTNSASPASALQLTTSAAQGSDFTGNVGPTLLAPDYSVVDSCQFSGNMNAWISTDTGIFTNCVFADNTPGTGHALLTMANGTLTGSSFGRTAGLAAELSDYSAVSGCTFFGNITNGYAGASALTIDYGSMANCSFITNGGSAVIATSAEGEVDVNGCQFRGNTNGTPLTCTAVVLNMRDSSFNLNVSPSGPGALFVTGASESVNIYGSAFWFNVGETNAGAIYSAGADLNVYNCTVYSNTLMDTTAPGGAGIRFDSGGAGLIANSILYNNTIPGVSGVTVEAQQFAGGQLSGGVLQPMLQFQLQYCILQGLARLSPPFGTGTSMDVDPAFANPALGYLQLQASSPAINRGGATVPNSLATTNDLAGNPRVVGSSVDIGAYEFQGTPLPRVIPMISMAETCDGMPSFNLMAPFAGATNFASFQYQWQVNTLDGNGFVPVTSSPVYTSITATNLQITHPPASMSGYVYQLVSRGNALEDFVSSNFTLPVVRPLIYVNQNVSGGTGDGSSWGNAMTDLQQAIWLAQGCSQIWVAQGTYVPDSGSFSPGPGVQIYGGFAGGETQLSQRDPIANPTILLSEASPVVEFTDTATPVTSVDGFYFQYYGTQTAVLVAGNGTMRNCIFTGTPAIAVYVATTNSSLFDNCQFLNGAYTAFYNVSGKPVLTNCLFSGNQSASGAGAFESFVAGSAQFIGCQFLNNSGPTAGGLAVNSGTSADISDCQFLGNSGGTGAIYVDFKVKATIGSSLFANNVAQAINNGGAISYNGTNLTVAFCTFVQNSGWAGAVSFERPGWSVDSSILWDNTGGPTVELSQFNNSSGQKTTGNITYSIIQGSSGDTNLAANSAWFPYFVNESSGDYHLVSISPAINQGNPAVGRYTNDLDGLARPQPRRQPEIGCYSYPGGTPSYPLKLTTFPGNSTVCPLLPATLSVVGPSTTNNAYIFDWQQFNGTAYTNIISSAAETLVQSGVTNSLVIAHPGDFDGAQFQLSIDHGLYTIPFQLSAPPPQTVYVNGNVGPGGDGTTWDTAYSSLSVALGAGSSCVQIWVAQGTYTADIVNSEPTLHSQVEILGGFNGTETDASQRDPVQNYTQIVNGSSPFLFLAGLGFGPADNSAILDGFHLTSYDPDIPIFFIQDAGPLVRNCVIENTTTAVAALYSSGMRFENCLFQYDADDSLLFEQCTNVQFINCQFSNNVALSSAPILILADVSGTTFSNCVFSDTSGTALGMDSVAGAALLNCVFSTNAANPSGASLYLEDSTIGLTNCQFLGNTGSPAIFSEDGSMALARCIFSGNTAPLGEAILAQGGTLSVRDSLVANNSATASGGAILAESELVKLLNDTIVDNSGTGGGDGVNVSGGSLAARNCIFWGNTDTLPYILPENAQVLGTSIAPAISFSIVQELNRLQDLTHDNIGYDPIFVNEASGNYSLASISPAIRSGSLVGITNTDVDILGNPREHQLAVDMGAYAFVGAPDNASDLIWDFSSRTVCAGTGTSFSVSNASPFAESIGWSTMVQWYVNTGGGFTLISDDSTYSITDITNGSVTVGSTLTFSSVDPSMDGYQYMFVLSGAVNYTSATATLSVASRSVIYVDASVSGPQDGTSWATAYNQLSQALPAAGSCASIWVAAGDYVQTSTLTIPPGVEIDGGFPSGGAWTDRNPTLNPVYIDGSGSAAGSEIFDVATAEPVGQHTVLDGLNFRQGGVAIECQAGLPFIRNCSFTNFTNSALFAATCNPFVTNCIFTGNSEAILIGGGILSVSHSAFSNNTEFAVYGDGGQMIITDSSFGQNVSQGNGACVYLFGSGASLARDIFAGNIASVGAAIYVDGASVMSVSNSLFYGNTSGFEGGVIANYGASTVVNCTLANNSADFGGGAFLLGGGNLLFENSISWNNASSDQHLQQASDAESYFLGGTLLATNSILQFTNGAAGVNIVTYDPLFNNPNSGDYTLNPYSPAVQAGNYLFAGPADTDLAGHAREFNTTIDMGAYESGLENNRINLLTEPQSITTCIGQAAQFSFTGEAGTGFQWSYNLGSGWVSLNDGDVILGSSVSIANDITPISVSLLTISNVTPALSGMLVQGSIYGGGYAPLPVTLTVPTNNIIFVDASAPAGGDGSSWASALNSIVDATGISSSCLPNIWVAQGTYRPTYTVRYQYGNYFSPLYSGYHDFFIPPGVTLLGGFPTGGGDLTTRDPAANPTILENPGVTNGYVVQIVTNTPDSDTNIVLDGFTIQGSAGVAGIDIVNLNPTLRNITVQGCGASGIVIQGSSALIENCRFVSNSGQVGGGASIFSASPTFLNCAFQGNTALESGGGIYAQQASPQFLDVLVTGNEAPVGGGIYSFGPATIINGTISGNRASSYGGGVVTEGFGTFNITNSIIWGNRSDAALTQAGGVVVGGKVYAPVATIEDQQLTAMNGPTFALANCTIGGLATLTGPGLVGEDPVFAAPLDGGSAPSTGGDFHLGPCSPLVNTGFAGAAYAISTDLDGQPRLVGGQIDLGPYESGVSTATPLLITAQPADLDFQTSAVNNTFSVSATGDGLTYQWQIAASNEPFASLTDGANFSGSTTPTLSVLSIPASYNGSLARCVVTTSEGCTAISSEAHLTVLPSRYYVNAAQPDDSGDGSTWATAFKTISHALSSPVDPSGAEIWVAAGVYASGLLQTGDLLYGGFYGNETSLDQRDWAANITTILPANTNVYVPGGNPYNVITFDTIPQEEVLSDTSIVEPPIALARIDGFQLGSANTVVYLEPGTTNFTVANCTFTNCDIGIWNNSGPMVEVTNSTFLKAGTGVYLFGAGRIDNSTFIGGGAGVQLETGSASVAGSQFTSNGVGISASIYSVAPSLTVLDSGFTGNTIGVFSEDGSLLVQRCKFLGNGSVTNQGGITGAGLRLGNAGPVEVDDSLFAGNFTPYEGAAVYNDETDNATFRNCTFSANRNTGIYVRLGSVDIYNCVLWGNVDAGLPPYWYQNTGVAYSNSLYSQVYGQITSQANNVIQNDATIGDPGFVNPALGDFHLSACSQVLTVGNPALIGSSVTDLDGQPRLFNGTVSPGAYQPASNPLYFTAQPTNAVALQNQTVTFAAAVAQTSGASYFWQVSVADGAFSDLADASPYTGARTPQLSFSAAALMNGNAYRLRVAYPSGCSIESPAAAFAIYAPTVSLNGPAANGILDLPSTNFTISMPGGIDLATLTDQSVAVYGSESGRLDYSSAMNSHAGEQISVTVDAGLESSNGFASDPHAWQFTADVTSWDGNFAATNLISTTAPANTLASGDVNFDGSVDLFVSTSAGCQVLTNSGHGHFADSGQTIGTSAAAKIVLASVSGHRGLDALILRNGAIEIWTNSGAGVFARQSSYSASTVADFAVGDFNNDGTPDIFLLTSAGDHVLWNDGAGNLTDSGMLLTDSTGSSVAVGDFNGDGWLDAIVVHSDSTPGQIWLNQNGVFAAGSTVSVFQRVTAADFNGDGNLDLLALSSTTNLAIYKGNGTGSFTSYWSGPAASAAAFSVGDINGDRRMDVVAPGQNGTLSVYTGAAGGFSSLSHQGAIGSAIATTLADYDGDGALDLALISPSGQLSTALYQPTQLYGHENVYPFFDLRDTLLINVSLFDDQFATRYNTSLRTITILTVPTNGYLIIGGAAVVSPGEVIDEDSIIYPPLSYLGVQNSSGRDSFTWKGSDAGGARSTVFHFDVTIAQNTVVAAVNDYAAVGQGGVTSLLTNGVTSVLQNDSDNDSQPLTASLSSGPAHGSVQVNSDGTFRYTHDGSYTHSDSFTYFAFDAYSGVSAEAFVYITVTNVDHTPNSLNLAQIPLYAGQPAGTVVGQLSSTDPDPQDSPHYTYTLVSGAGSTDNASFVISGSILLTTGPLSIADGTTRSIRIRTTDAGGEYDEATFTIPILPLPVAISQSVGTLENGSGTNITITGTGNGTLTYIIVSPPTNGVLRGTAPNLNYVPATNYFGPDSFSFQVTDGVMTSPIASVEINVQFVDEAPVATNQFVTTAENTPVNFTLNAQPYLNTEHLAYQVDTSYLYGTLSGTAPNLVYTPPANFHGDLAFTFTASENGLTSAVTIVYITVSHVNQAPVAISQSATIQENSLGYVYLEANDPDFDAVSYRIITAPTHGSLSGLVPGTFSVTPQKLTYRPTLNYSGTDSFTYVANDGQLDSALATMTINVAPIPIPVASNLTVYTTEGQPVDIQLIGANAAGAFTNLPISFRLLSGTSHGFLLDDANGSNITYTPTALFYGNDSFTYVTTINGGFDSTNATVDIIVQPYPPTAESFIVTNYGGPISFNLLGSDPAGLPLTYVITGGPTNGTLGTNSLPLVSYTPGNWGMDMISYQTVDSRGASSIATVTVMIIEPQHFADVGNFDTNCFLGIPMVINPLPYDSDPAGDVLTVIGVDPPSSGTAFVSNNLIYYTATNLDGYDSFGYYVTNNSEVSEGFVGIQIFDRAIVLGTTNLQYLNNSFVLATNYLQDAISFANSFGPSLPWRILDQGNPLSPEYPVHSLDILTNPEAITENGDLSALDITGNIVIQPWEYAEDVTITAAPGVTTMRLFQIEPGARLRLENCNLYGGIATEGGAIYNEGTLELFDCVVTNNAVIGQGSSPGLGGAIFSLNGQVTITNSVIAWNLADLGGGIYQMGDGTNTSLTVSNAVFFGHGEASDFYSTNSNGGTSAITSTLLDVEHPTFPSFGELDASYLVTRNFSNTFTVLMDPSRFHFTVTPAFPWNDGVQLVVSGAGTERTLAFSQSETNDQAPQNISLSLSDGHASFTENFSIAVDSSALQHPIAVPDYVAMDFETNVTIPVLANDVNLNGPHSALTLVRVSHPHVGTATIVGTNIVYTTGRYDDASQDTFTYVVSANGLQSTGTVVVSFYLGYLPTIYYSADGGYGTLRSDLEFIANNYHPGGYDIVLDPTFDSPVITASYADDTSEGASAYVIAEDVTIDGSELPGATLLVDSNAPPMRLFHVLPGGHLTLRNFTLSGGRAIDGNTGPAAGGAIYNEGTVDLENVTIQNCGAAAVTGAPSVGGAIYNIGSLILNNTVISNNFATTGGGIYQFADGTGAMLAMTNSLLENIESASDLAGVATNGGSVSSLVIDSVIRTPATPWVAEISDLSVRGTNAVPVYIGQGAGVALVTATSDNPNVVPNGNLTVTGTGSLRQLSVTAAGNGVSHILLQASESGVSFARNFTLDVTGNTILPLTAPDLFLPMYSSGTLTLPVLTNIINPGNGQLYVVSASGATNGSVTVTNNELVYVNNGDGATNDYISYEVTNTFGGEVSGRVYLSVLPDSLTITNAAQFGPGSLGDAISYINGVAGNWTLVVSPSLNGQTVTLTQFGAGQYGDYTACDITGHVRIDGSAAPGFTIAGYFLRPFRVQPGGTLELVNLNLIDGTAYGELGGVFGTPGLGGAVANLGTFYAEEVVFDNDIAEGGGGGAVLNNGGEATIVRSTFRNNSVGGETDNWPLDWPASLGGAIFNYNGTLTLASNNFSDNTASYGANVYNVGDGTNSSIMLTANVMSNILGISDLSAAVLNGGSSFIESYETNIMVVDAPFIAGIPDMEVSGSTNIAFAYESVSFSPSLTAFSSYTALLPDAGLVITTNSSVTNLSVTTGGGGGSSLVTLELTDGGLTFAEAFNIAGAGLASQTISFGALANVAYGAAPFAISATASSGLPVTFSVVSGPATISGNTVTVTGIGEVTIEATQAGDGSFLAATPVLQSFATSIAPVASTLYPSNVTTTSATLSSLVYPKNAATTVSFAWGTTISFEHTNVITTLPSELGGYYISNVLSGLNPGTTYFYTVVASNADGVVVGSVFSFTTTVAPVASTLLASNVTTTSAMLNSLVYPKDAPTTVSFAWGTTPSLGHTNVATTLPAEYGGYNIGTVLSGLEPGTYYFYSVIASNTNGTAVGNLFAFTTTIAPVVETLIASNITTTSAMLSSLVYPKDAPTTVAFAWGTTPNLGTTNLVTTLPAEYGGYSISNVLSGLEPGTVYFYSAVATNTNGTASGSIFSFTTPVGPAVSTMYVSNVTATSATLNGEIFPRNAPTTASFVWGTTTNFGNTNQLTPLPAEYGGYYVTNAISGLQPATQYFYSLMATNTNGVAIGNTLAFTTIGGSVTPGRSQIMGAQFVDGVFTIEFSGIANWSYVLQWTTNLTDWTSMNTNSSPGSLRYFIDPSATNAGYRYYRVVPGLKSKTDN